MRIYNVNYNVRCLCQLYKEANYRYMNYPNKLHGLIQFFKAISQDMNYLFSFRKEKLYLEFYFLCKNSVIYLILSFHIKWMSLFFFPWRFGVITLIWNQASPVQYRISQAEVISTPPPTQALCMAAITGLEHCPKKIRFIHSMAKFFLFGRCLSPTNYIPYEKMECIAFFINEYWYPPL